MGLHSMPKHRLEGESGETERDEMVDLSKLIGRVFVEILTDFLVFVDFLNSFSELSFSAFILITSVLCFLTLFARLSHLLSSLFNSLSFSLRHLFALIRSAFTRASSSLRFFKAVLKVAVS